MGSRPIILWCLSSVQEFKEFMGSYFGSDCKEFKEFVGSYFGSDCKEFRNLWVHISEVTVRSSGICGFIYRK